MLEDLTLGSIATALAFIVGIVSGITALASFASKIMSKTVGKTVSNLVKPHINSMNENISSLTNKIDGVQKTVDATAKDTKSNTARISDLSKKIANVQATADDTAKANAQNYIKSFLSDLDAGHACSQLEFECFFQNLAIFEKYEGNGFIHSWIDRLTAEGKFNNVQTEMLNSREGRPKNHS